MEIIKEYIKEEKLILNLIKNAYITNSIILTMEEAIKIVKLFHKEIMHFWINSLSFEIERRGLYIYKLQELIKVIVNNCEICLTHKLNKFIKPINLSKKECKGFNIFL